LVNDTLALCEQVRTVAKTRLIARRGLLSPTALARIERALLIALDLPGQTSR
jgi:mRNA-degrading endonuclease toxin of MazEF toxin-antitoxin module